MSYRASYICLALQKTFCAAYAMWTIILRQILTFQMMTKPTTLLWVKSSTSFTSRTRPEGISIWGVPISVLLSVTHCGKQFWSSLWLRLINILCYRRAMAADSLAEIMLVTKTVLALRCMNQLLLYYFHSE